jgi:hypothetical protein
MVSPDHGQATLEPHLRAQGALLQDTSMTVGAGLAREISPAYACRHGPRVCTHTLQTAVQRHRYTSGTPGAPQGITRSRPAGQTRSVAPLARRGRYERCSYANCVSSLSTAPACGHWRPRGGLPTRICPQHWHLDIESGAERVRCITRQDTQVVRHKRGAAATGRQYQTRGLMRV